MANLCVLIDTNVWIDNYIPVRQGSALSREFIATAKKHQVQLVYPVHVLKDVFYNLGATLKYIHRSEQDDLSEADALAIQEIVWSCIDNMSSLAIAVGTDESDAWKARKYRSFSSDLEDNFVMVAAERVHASFVVTRDELLLQKSTVPAYTPEEALGHLAVELP